MYGKLAQMAKQNVAKWRMAIWHIWQNGYGEPENGETTLYRLFRLSFY